MSQRINELTRNIIGAAIEVHRALGPGLLESAYQRCLAIELEKRKIQFESQKTLALYYHGILIPEVYRLDFIVKTSVLVEVKSVQKWDPIFEAQVLTYLKLTGLKVGLLLNFNVPVLQDGIKRIVLGFNDDFSAPRR